MHKRIYKTDDYANVFCRSHACTEGVGGFGRTGPPITDYEEFEGEPSHGSRSSLRGNPALVTRALVGYSVRSASWKSIPTCMCTRKCTMVRAAELDLVYTHAKSKLKIWEVLQMSKQTDPGMNFTDVSNFRASFKKFVFSIQRNLIIHFREFGDALWIRIAWGKDYMKPNQYRPSFIVYHIQTPYVFMTSLTKTQQPLVCQGLLSAAGYDSIEKMDLKSRYLESLQDIVFKRFSQPFQSYQSRSAPEESCMPTTVNQRADSERMKGKARVRQAMLETLGDGGLPVLECADYMLDTPFKGEAGIANKIKPFQCMVKFSSPHILESVRSLAQSGLSEAPVSSLFSAIISKGKNIFYVSEKKESSGSRGDN
ncbi:centromere protein N isoform X1 [Ranitomeya variabilis]|uniref:centromere protein N isoform X1 n=1 Tax=Ranitomeya variabilis TaxID=490064 RepID=UPI00405712A9